MPPRRPRIPQTTERPEPETRSVVGRRHSLLISAMFSRLLLAPNSLSAARPELAFRHPCASPLCWWIAESTVANLGFHRWKAMPMPPFLHMCVIVARRTLCACYDLETWAPRAHRDPVAHRVAAMTLSYPPGRRVHPPTSSDFHPPPTSVRVHGSHL